MHSQSAYNAHITQPHPCYHKSEEARATTTTLSGDNSKKRVWSLFQQQQVSSFSLLAIATLSFKLHKDMYTQKLHVRSASHVLYPHNHLCNCATYPSHLPQVGCFLMYGLHPKNLTPVYTVSSNQASLTLQQLRLV